MRYHLLFGMLLESEKKTPHHFEEADIYTSKGLYKQSIAILGGRVSIVEE